jgi:crossover junction endodeoxyribonuclease RuvC
MIAIGIDPGTVRTGYGVVRKDGARLTRLASGTIRTHAKDPMEKRLVAIHQGLEQVLTTYGPDEAAIEDVFFAKNAQSALKLGQVRGVILLTVSKREIPVASYAPTFVKRSVVGSGRAAKNQVGRVVQAILGLGELPDEDEGDALAVAICHVNAPRLPKTATPIPRGRPTRRRT